VARPVARTIDDPQRLTSFRQREQQRVIAPAAIVRDVDFLLALTARFDDVAVHIDGGLLEELVRLPCPHGLPRFVDRLLE
jgi:hypothetical protein